MTEPKDSLPNTSAAEPVLFGAPVQEKEPRNWTPLIVGFALVLVVVAIAAIVGRESKPPLTTADPYAPNLVVEEAALSQADNFVGSTVTYIDLKVKNNGSRTVVGGSVRAVFKDTLGEVVQTEILPLRALVPHALNGEQQEAADLATAPLGPGQERMLRLTIEHVSSEWNQAQPELEFRGLQFK